MSGREGHGPRPDGRGSGGNAPSSEREASSQFRAGLLIVFLGALVLRLAYLWELRDADVSYILVGDGYLYDRWAKEIARGHWLGGDVFYQAPLYPYFLGVVYRLLPASVLPALVVRLVQAFLGATACALLALAGRSFFSATVGLIAGGLLAVYAPAIFFDGLIQKATLDLLLTTVLLWALAEVRPETGAGRLLASGLVLGLLCLTRENALVLVPVISVWLFLARGARRSVRRLGYVGVFLLGLGLVLGPVALRNRFVGGEWFLTTAQFGPNFFIGNHARADGLYAPLRSGRGDPRFERQDATELAEAALGRRLTAGEVSHYWTQRTLTDIQAAPGRWLQLLGRKVALTWNATEFIDSDDPAVYADSSLVLRGLGWLVHFGTVAPLAAVGVWTTRARWRRLGLLYAILAAVTASVALFYVFARYRYLLVPVVLLFAAAAVPSLVEAWRAGRGRELAAAAGILLVSAVGVNVTLVRNPVGRAVMYRNMGVTLGREGLPEEALRYYRKAVAASPAYVEARMSLARTLAVLGRRDEAMREYVAVLSLQPGLREAESGLQTLLKEAWSGPGPASPPPR